MMSYRICPRNRPLPASRRDYGFTLLEVMVAIVVLSIIMTTAFGALRLGARSWEAGVTRSLETEDFRTATGILQRLASQMLAFTWPDDVDKQIVFTGEQDQCRFVAPAPQQYQDAGLFEYTLAVTDSASGKQLVLSYMPYNPGGSDFQNPESDHQLVLADRLTEVNFEYFGINSTTGAKTENAPEAWHRQWAGQAQELPKLMKISVQANPGEQQWPDLIVPVYARHPS